MLKTFIEASSSPHEIFKNPHKLKTYEKRSLLIWVKELNNNASIKRVLISCSIITQLDANFKELGND